MEAQVNWYDIDPMDARSIDCSKRPDLNPPRNEEGEVCPWPWEPQQLVGVPMGQYHCGYCGAMVMAGMRHPDYNDFEAEYERYMREQEAAGVKDQPIDLSDPFEDRPPA